MHLLPVAAFFGLAHALTTTVTIYLPPKPNPNGFPPATHATLSTLGKHHSAPLTTANTFVFHNVTSDSYLVDVHCPTDAFVPLRLDVKEDGNVFAWETYRGNEWGNKGEQQVVKDTGLGKGVEVRALGAKVYFVERPTFSVLTILKNPMILMGLVSMAIFLGMPYLMDNMDPEMRAEFEEQQRKGPMAALMGGGGSGGKNDPSSFDMAAYLAGSKPKESGSKNQNRSQNKGVRR